MDDNRPPDVVHQVIGERGRLSKREARAAAGMTKKPRTYLPRGCGGIFAPREDN